MTTVLNAYASAYPLITNRIRSTVSRQTSPYAPIASEIKDAPHPIRTWNFSGLPRDNYSFSMDEIDGSGNVIQNLALFAVVPSEHDGELVRDDEQITVDVTDGFVAGENEFTFDGSSTGGSPVSTLAKQAEGNIAPAHAVATWSGIPAEDDEVQVDFTVDLNDVDPPSDFSITSVVLAGWTLANLITDIYNQIAALRPGNTFLYNDGTYNGIRVRGFSTATIAVTVTLAPGAPGSTKPDYRGWEIVPSELTGRGILNKGLDYSWDKVTGRLLLLQAGDVFYTGNTWNIHFNCQTDPVGNSYPTITDFGFNRITASTTLTNDYFGKKLIAEPAGDYIEATLPDIDTVVEGRKMMVEVNADHVCCVKFVPVGGTLIKFLRGNLYAIPNESFSIYKYIRSGVAEWRVCEADGNFKTVGQSTSDDLLEADVFGKQLLDGSSLNMQQYARLYQEFILNLPLLQVVDYDDWATGDNKYFFSLANSANPANINKFMVADRRGIFERNNSDVGIAGDYEGDTMQDHYHLTGHEMTTNGGFYVRGGVHTVEVAAGAGAGNTNQSKASSTGDIYDTGTIGIGTETKPKNYLINKYVLI